MLTDLDTWAAEEGLSQQVPQMLRQNGCGTTHCIAKLPPGALAFFRVRMESKPKTIVNTCACAFVPVCACELTCRCMRTYYMHVCVTRQVAMPGGLHVREIYSPIVLRVIETLNPSLSIYPSLPVEHRPSTTPRHRTLFWGRYHGGRRPSSDDSFHSPNVILHRHSTSQVSWSVTIIGE